MIVANNLGAVRFKTGTAMRVCMAAIAFGLAPHAYADCVTDVSGAAPATTCTDATTGQQSLLDNGATLSVVGDATLSSSAAPSVIVSIPVPQGIYGRTATLTVDGAILADTTAAIAVSAGSLGPYYYDFSGTTADIKVSATGRIAGAQAISLSQTSGNYYGPAIARIDNAGSISGTTGPALIADSKSYFSQITNRATGTIGAIQGRIDGLTNEGIIDGGTLGAIVASTDSFNGVTIDNGGTITSASADGTIRTGNLNLSMTNRGTISNSGGGVAISGSYFGITNEAGGTIAGTGAINANTALYLTNKGTITGDIVIGGSAYNEASSIDSTQGTINGNVSFGSSNDLLFANYVDGAIVTGINGSINGGGGTNTLQLNTPVDVTLDRPLALPTNFQTLYLKGDGKVTLGAGFGGVATITSSGTLINKTTLDGVKLVLGGYSQFTNDGTIRTGSDSVVSSAGFGFINNGTIEASGTGTAVSVFLGNSGFTNSGTIRSADGTALNLGISCSCFSSSNSGTIEGGTIGAVVGGLLENTGTITGGVSGVELHGTLDNRAGGIVSGGINAITTNSGFGAGTVKNAGTINGDVNIATTSYYYGGGSTFIAEDGGTLNGNLTLGAGDRLITKLGSGTGFAGINGSVFANNSALIYSVAGNASTTTIAPSGFSALGFELQDGASLALSGSGHIGSTVTLAGSGAITISGTIDTTDDAPLSVRGLVSVGGYSSAVGTLAIVNNGTLSAARSDGGEAYFNGLSLGENDTLTNNGTISLDFGSNYYSPSTVVSGGASITNTGQIVGKGAYGIVAGSFLIRQTVTNSGSINSDIAAIALLGNASVVNSGTLSGSNGPAITSTLYGYGTPTVSNLASGVISGVGTAISLQGGTLNNAGTINGSVDLGYSPYGRSYGAAIYVADGGTINGDLLFGKGYNWLVETGKPLGVTGQIIADGIVNQVVHRRSSTATVELGESLPTGFTSEATEALGADTVVTLQAAKTLSSDIYVLGGGAIVNKVNTTGGVNSSYSFNNYASQPQLASFTNAGLIGWLGLNAASLANTGTIGSKTLQGAALTTFGSGPQSLSNIGTIANDGTEPAVRINSYAPTTISFSNSGSIAGGVQAWLTPSWGSGPIAQTTAQFANSGTITGYADGMALEVYASGDSTVSFNNTGAITGDVFLGGKNVSLASSGHMTGSIGISAQTSTITLAGAFAGDIRVYDGASTLHVTGGTAAAPVALGTVRGIGQYDQTSGLATLAGTSTFDTMTLGGGRLIGLAGSTITSGTISVGAGATFGSAGVVNGALTVKGTLSPGASPGTMTVYGDVTLASGSTSLFELAPTVSDSLVVNGKLAIQPGSTLAIAASRPLIPGTKLSLISASGGVTGGFDQVIGLTGVAKTRGSGVDLLVQFAPVAGASPSMAGIVGYLNTAIAKETASPALLAAMPLLVDGQGASSAGALRRISPEPYASALQIGVENGLMLSDALRAQGSAELTPGHGFAFGQGLANWRRLDGSVMRGVGATQINGAGLLGGLGYAWHGVSIAGFVGYLNQQQRISSLDATNRADGMFGGVNLGLVAGRSRLAVTVFHDHSDATTNRSLPGAVQSTGRYGLHSWGIDLQLQTTRALGRGWQLTPHAGTMWVRTHRDAVQELADSVFALDVRAGHRTAGFIDGGLRFEGPDVSRWSRSLDLSVRYQVHGRSALARAEFADLGDALVTRGARRERVAGIAKIGIGYRLRPGMSLFAQGLGEASDGATRISASGGLRAVF
ncbi:autotransporter outer membrane beta-barrel domain-containing protein [Novosphingobium sp. FKTRR1]|uniref:autotransporter outer membrane beta-barrel domain-containing protein n=1 Tax=Novosphingobium sp. FKTRR1 TaxID=2879118 RepID=UPI001CF0A304|nr:autotransporter outer membrane beta-barrel domain-containing protein [Novosphingobium sp. FKTRR1]